MIARHTRRLFSEQTGARAEIKSALLHHRAVRASIHGGVSSATALGVRQLSRSTEGEPAAQMHNSRPVLPCAAQLWTCLRSCWPWLGTTSLSRTWRKCSSCLGDRISRLWQRRAAQFSGLFSQGLRRAHQQLRCLQTPVSCATAELHRGSAPRHGPAPRLPSRAWRLSRGSSCAGDRRAPATARFARKARVGSGSVRSLPPCA
jgi:hypothetical protein